MSEEDVRGLLLEMALHHSSLIFDVKDNSQRRGSPHNPDPNAGTPDCFYMQQVPRYADTTGESMLSPESRSLHISTVSKSICIS